MMLNKGEIRVIKHLLMYNKVQQEKCINRLRQFEQVKAYRLSLRALNQGKSNSKPLRASKAACCSFCAAEPAPGEINEDLKCLNHITAPSQAARRRSPCRRPRGRSPSPRQPGRNAPRKGQTAAHQVQS